MSFLNPKQTLVFQLQESNLNWLTDWQINSMEQSPWKAQSLS
jgi:hypothetical protein